MNLLKRYAVPVACAMTVLMMTACSSTKDERRVPTPLTEFKPVLNVQQVCQGIAQQGGMSLLPSQSAPKDYKSCITSEMAVRRQLGS